MAEGPITHNGIHPITGKKTTVVKEGVAGSAKPSTPKPAQVAAEGATNTGASGQHMQNGVTKVLPATTMAEMMYPKKLGLRGQEG